MEKRGGELIGAIVIFFILLFVYTRFAGPIPFSVNNTNTATTDVFQVQGTGKASAVPDNSVIALGVTTQAASSQQAQAQANQAANRIINALKNQGIEEKKIKTINYTINPNYSFSGETQRINGYSVSQNFEVEVPIEKTNQIVDAGTGAGANIVSNISFKLNDEKQEELKNKARQEAVDKAKDSAEGLAKAAGIRLGKIINVSESFGGEPIPVFAREAVGSPEDQTETNITPGETNVEVSVTLTYQTL